MALFKILRGNKENLPIKLTDGYAYFCADTGEFFVDVGSTGEDGARRVQVTDPNITSVKLQYWDDGDENK